LQRLGVSRPVVGLVVPAGYSFNLDGTSIYLTMAAVFIAQATNTPLDLAHQIGLLGILLLTSKGAAGVTGSGFIVLGALSLRWAMSRWRAWRSSLASIASCPKRVR
jgi:aerobic C4-dicarboxylate transport protein